MIKRVFRDFDPKNSSYKDLNGKDKAGDLKDLLDGGFVEFLGETNPKSVSEVSYSSDKPFFPTLYEYTWSVGMVGKTAKWCEKLDEDDSIVVQLIFNTKKSRFYIREIVADLKQLPPFKKDKNIFSGIQSYRSLFGTVGKSLEIAGSVAPGVAVPGKIISAIAETKLNTVSTKEFPWWIKTLCNDNESGVEWHVSKSYMQNVGGRFVGTLVAYFIDCNSTSNNGQEKNLSIEIRAFLRGRPAKDGVSDELFINSTNPENKTFLQITPI